MYKWWINTTNKNKFTGSPTWTHHTKSVINHEYCIRSCKIFPPLLKFSLLMQRLWWWLPRLSPWSTAASSVPQELLRSSQGLSEDREEVRRRLTEATDRVRQLEEDLLGVTQRGLQKETELDWWAENAIMWPSIIQSHPLLRGLGSYNDCVWGGVCACLLLPRHLHHSTRLRWVDKIMQSAK